MWPCRPGVLRRSSGANGDPGIVEDQPGLVIAEAAGEIKGWGGVVVSLACAFIGGAPLRLLQLFNAKADRTDVGGRGSRTGAGR